MPVRTKGSSVCVPVYLSIQVCEKHTDIRDHYFRNQGTELRQKAREGLHTRPLSSQLLTGLLSNLSETHKNTQSVQNTHNTRICTIWATDVLSQIFASSAYVCNFFMLLCNILFTTKVTCINNSYNICKKNQSTYKLANHYWNRSC